MQQAHFSLFPISNQSPVHLLSPCCSGFVLGLLLCSKYIKSPQKVNDNESKLHCNQLRYIRQVEQQNWPHRNAEFLSPRDLASTPSPLSDQHARWLIGDHLHPSCRIWHTLILLRWILLCFKGTNYEIHIRKVTYRNVILDFGKCLQKIEEHTEGSQCKCIHFASVNGGDTWLARSTLDNSFSRS